ncbi:MAG: response regulator transcription factor [Chitinophagales bacterium]|nr:response regulator transcription factor [Chitinophagales bacterium]
MIRIGIVDDQPLFVQGLSRLLEDQPDIVIGCSANSGKQLTEMLDTHHIDILLMDLEMPDEDGFQLIKRLQQDHPDVLVIVLTMHNDPAIIIEMVQLGARGFLTKDAAVREIIDAVFSVRDTGYFFNDHMSTRVLCEAVKKGNVSASFSKPELSEREQEVLRLICAEKTNKEIADHLILSVRTVDGHRERILAKIGARNTAGIVLYAIRNGLVEL